RFGGGFRFCRRRVGTGFGGCFGFGRSCRFFTTGRLLAATAVVTVSGRLFRRGFCRCRLGLGCLRAVGHCAGLTAGGCGRPGGRGRRCAVVVGRRRSGCGAGGRLLCCRRAGFGLIRIACRDFG